MAKLVKKGDKCFVLAKGGYRDTDRIPSTKIQVKPPIKKVDEFEFDEDNRYGHGVHIVRIYEDSAGKQFAVHEFHWYPAFGYSWDEDWEVVTDNADEINSLLAEKIEKEEELE